MHLVHASDRWMGLGVECTDAQVQGSCKHKYHARINIHEVDAPKIALSSFDISSKKNRFRGTHQLVKWSIIIEERKKTEGEKNKLHKRDGD